MSKPITATAVMALRDEGNLKLDDSICVYLKPCPDSWQPFNLTNLLTHTSGIPDVVKFPDYMTFRVQPHTPQQMVELIASRPVDFAPDAKFVYCNSNFILLGVVIQKASGASYEQYLAKSVLKPAGMNSTGYEAKPPGPMANGYVRDGESYRAPDSVRDVGALLRWRTLLYHH